MKDYKNLMVWQRSHKAVLNIYKLTKSYPREEQFGIVSQLRRAMISVPNNIVEGCGKFTQKDFAKYLQQSLGSCQESEYLLFLSFELGYLEDSQFQPINQEINEIKAMLISLIKKVRATP